MSEVPFYATRMGARYYEHTVPELVRQVDRLCGLVERLADAIESDDSSLLERLAGAEGARARRTNNPDVSDTDRPS